MKFKKTLAALAVIAAGSTLAFGQALTAKADDVPAEETAPAEEYLVPAEESVTVEEAAAPVETTPAEETVIEVTTEALYDSIGTTTTVTKATAVAVPTTTVKAVTEEETTTTTIPYLDKELYDAVDTDSDAGKAQLEDKDIDYDKIYNDFLYDVIVPNTEGGISDTTESGKSNNSIIADDTGEEVRVYTEMLGVFAATVHDFCNDGIPELITVTNVEEIPPSNELWDLMDHYASRIVYDLWQYSKADDSFHRISTTDSEIRLHITNNGIFEVGNQDLSVKLAGDTVLEEYSVDSRGDASAGHSYIMYQVNDDYSFKTPYIIAASWGIGAESKKDYAVLRGGTFDPTNGYIDFDSIVEYTDLDAVKAAFEAYGVDADITASFGKNDADVSVSNIKNNTPLFDYKAYPERYGVHYNLTDYTGVHGNASAGTDGKTGNESTKAANKNDSPKTGVAFPIAAAGTGAAALALAAFTVISKKKDE